jgi:hypothetical protein
MKRQLSRTLLEQVGLDCPLPNKLGKIKAMPLQNAITMCLPHLLDYSGDVPIVDEL